MSRDAGPTQRRIDQFFSGPGARADDWRDLVDAAKAWARGGDRGKYDAALADLSVTEEFHGYPGLQLMGALREAAAAGDGATSLALATRITQALATRSFRQHAGDWGAKDEGDGDVPELVPPTFGAHTTRRPTGAAGGMPAGSQTMSAAIGSAEQAITSGVVKLPEGMKLEDASGIIALSYGITYISVVGLKSAVNELGEMWGRIARTNTSTDLLTLAVGMIIGFLIGMVEFPAFGAKIGLGNAGGLLLSGVIVSSLVSRLRFFGNTPNAARNVLEDLGLVVFVAIVGVNAGAGLLAQLTGAVALKIFVAGFIACTIPPFVVWAIGYHVFKINPAVLMGGVAGARSHSGPCREAAVEIQSSVPWIGFPVGYAVSGILLTVFGYFAMILAQ